MRASLGLRARLTLAATVPLACSAPQSPEPAQASPPASATSSPASAPPPPPSTTRTAATSVPAASVAPPTPSATASTAPELPEACVAKGRVKAWTRGPMGDNAGVPDCAPAITASCCGKAGGIDPCGSPLLPAETKRWRGRGFADVCCYAGRRVEDCEGRPLFVEGRVRVAGWVVGVGWG